MSVESVWATLSWLLPYPISGISRHPSRMGLIWTSPRILEKVLHASYIVLDPGSTSLQHGLRYYLRRNTGGSREIRRHRLHSVWEWAPGRSRKLLRPLTWKRIPRVQKGADRFHRTEACENHQASPSCRGILKLRKPSEWMIMDVIPVYPTGYPSHGTAGRRTFCNHRLKRLV